MWDEEGAVLASGAPEAGTEADADTLLADLAQEAYAWSLALSSLRQSRRHSVMNAALVAARADAARPAAARAVIHTQQPIEAILLAAESDVLLVDPGSDTAGGWLVQLAPMLIEAAERGCHLRVLLGRWLATPDSRKFAERVEAAGGEVRTASTPDYPMLTVDHTAALLPEPAAVVVVNAPHVVRLLLGFVELAWSGGQPLHAGAWFTEGISVGGDVLSPDLHRRIVQLLAGGAKDETIARLLGMSVRTCRRHIADIMTRLGSVSRFQAGANAVRLGLTGIDSAVSPHR